MESQVISGVENLPALPKLLADFGTSLGLNTPFSQWEKLRHLDAEISFPLENLAPVSPQLWAELEEKFGDSLNFTLVQERETLLSKSMGVLTSTQIAELKRIYGGDTSVTLRLNINKDLLAQSLGFVDESQEQQIFLYLFADRLPQLLSRNLLDCDRDLWNNKTDAQIVILVCDQDILLHGDYLVVCGGSHLPSWNAHLRIKQDENDQYSTEKMRSIRRANLNWETQWVNGLTPLHFHLSAGQGLSSSLLSRVCALQCARLFLLYSGENTLSKEEKVLSIFKRGQTPVRVPWPQLPSDAVLGSANFELENNVSHLVSLVRWIYQPTWATERLSMTQLYLSDELRAYEPQACFPELLRQAARIESDLQGRWKDFIGKKLDDYSEQERKLEEDIGKAIGAFDDQIAAIIKSLVESGTAAAVAVTASFLTGYFRTPFNATAFTIGLCVYAGYILLFPIGIGLSHHWGRYRASVNEFGSKLARIGKRLEKKKIDEVLAESQFEANKIRLRHWLWGACGIYLILFVSALYGAFFLPDTLASTEVGSSTNISSPVGKSAKPRAVLTPRPKR